MNKKRFMLKGFFVFFIVVGVLVNVVMGADLEDVQDNLLEGADRLDDTKETITSTSTSYLIQEWKTIILRNPFFSAIDSFLSRISIIFDIFFGIPYSFSPIFLFVVIIWFYFFFKIKEIMGYTSSFSSTVSILISFGIVLALAQIGFFGAVYKFFRWLIFLSDSLIGQILVFIAILIIMFLIYRVTTNFGISFKKNKEEMEKYQSKVERGTLHSFVEALKGAFK